MKKLTFTFILLFSCAIPLSAAAPQERTIEDIDQQLREIRLRLIELRLQPQTESVITDRQKLEEQQQKLEQELENIYRP